MSRQRKTAVEECQFLSVRDLVHYYKFLRPNIFQELEGTGCGLGGINQLGIFVNTLDMTRPHLTLSYSIVNVFLRTSKPVLHQINLHAQQLSSNLIWFFCCPVCDKHVDRLFLPRGKRFFGCRHCWRLNYRSSQRSHTSYERSVRQFEAATMAPSHPPDTINREGLHVSTWFTYVDLDVYLDTPRRRELRFHRHPRRNFKLPRMEIDAFVGEGEAKTPLSF